MKLPPRSKYVSSSESASSLTPNSLLHEFPMLMPPSAIGETLTLAVGDRTRCQPSAVFGFGGGAKGSISV
jgi:hypothetical protein